jgi:DNA-binding NarL/FixJ family response regulator
MQEQPLVLTIVVSRPGVMQQALRTSLSICPAITVLASIGDGLTAVTQIAVHHPALVVIDANLLPEEAEALVTAVKAEPAPPRCLVFVQSHRHEPMMMNAGADAVLLRDDPADEFQAVLKLLTAPEP